MTDNSVPPPIGAVPGYPDVRTYVNDLGYLNVWEGDGWKEESMSWKTGCYMATNLSGPMEFTYSGRGAQAFLSRLVINDVYNWPLSTSKHLVMTGESGLIVSHGLAVRDAEDSFRMLAALPWPAYYASQHGTAGLEVNVSWRDTFILQIAGPRSIDVIEKALGASVRDLPFLGIQKVKLAGAETELVVELSRIGMTGSLAYEVRGAYEDGPAVYDAIYRIGQEFGITRLGWRTYAVNHTEGGFPQMSFHFLPSVLADEAFLASPFALSLTNRLSGSIDPSDIRARFRTPSEVNWSWMAKFDHDFVGRAAVEAEKAARKRKTVILRWNPEDVLDTFASHFRKGEEYKYIEFPCAPQSPAGGHADLVTKDGTAVGISSAAVYSYFYREMISQTTIDIDQATIGNEVVVHWGDFGGRIKPIRATVERFPYLDLPRNKEIDVTGAAAGTSVPAQQ
ncbi:aminomethyl transferase family protein [Streptomyces sp. NPDC057474]|uniref:aminomethyl transferase family protein n=1 Tax=Streptomyces sp. NPDC057474 TaxID=3346144 RepID=UPI0036788B97